ncbi:peptidase propeptide and YPEB domain protein [Neisseria mucosa ATCC 25996]|uniref:Peptidase propeptide and YPEB domain protein n=2 Tax=Neisseria mucosa TaxID=488 RepID=D2ZWD9_NEIM2|nr:peptidase propeptide and YPEB domain protein [Neisseria mucosa ATCC 25996]
MPHKGPIMKLRALSLLAVSAALISGSLTAAAAPHKHSRSISQAQAVKIAKKRVGSGRVTDVDYSRGRWEIEIRRGCTEYDVDVSSQSGRVIKVDTDNHCDD